MPTLAEILAGALAQAGLETTSDIWRIGDAWPTLVGQRIAQRATPLELRRDELVLAVPDAVWRQELSFLGPEIVARVNGLLGAPRVARLRLQSAAPRPPEERHSYRRLDSTAPRAVPDALAADADADLPADIDGALRRLARVRAARLERDAAARPVGPRHTAPRR